MSLVSVDIDLGEFNTYDLIGEVEDRGYVVVDKDVIAALNTALKLKKKEDIVEILDDIFVACVGDSFAEVFEVE